MVRDVFIMSTHETKIALIPHLNKLLSDEEPPDSSGCKSTNKVEATFSGYIVPKVIKNERTRMAAIVSLYSTHQPYAMVAPKRSPVNIGHKQSRTAMILKGSKGASFGLLATPFIYFDLLRR